MYNFKLLTPISNILHVLGVCVAAISILLGMYLISESSSYALLPCIGIMLGGITLGVLILFVSQLINLLLQIEQNTRKQKEEA